MQFWQQKALHWFPLGWAYGDVQRAVGVVEAAGRSKRSSLCKSSTARQVLRRSRMWRSCSILPFPT